MSIHINYTKCKVCEGAVEVVYDSTYYDGALSVDHYDRNVTGHRVEIDNTTYYRYYAEAEQNGLFDNVLTTATN